jgi:hypothetical protein
MRSCTAMGTDLGTDVSDETAASKFKVVRQHIFARCSYLCAVIKRHNIPEDRYIDLRHGELLISHFVGFLFSRIATKSNHDEVKYMIATPLAVTYN